MIQHLEEISMNHWASLQTYLYDGWILRFANGYTKRANSINPIYSSTIDLDKKIQHCEGIYRKKNLPVVFKLTEISVPQNLDQELENRGYRKIDLTSVQILNIREYNATISKSLTCSQLPIEDWLAAFSDLRRLNIAQKETLYKMLDNNTCMNCYAVLQEHGSVKACGLGVQSDGYVGLFDIIVNPQERGQGYGNEITNYILNWAKEYRVHAAYLQVVVGNISAEHLYKKLGFKEAYRYWYRINDVWIQRRTG